MNLENTRNCNNSMIKKRIKRYCKYKPVYKRIVRSCQLTAKANRIKKFEYSISLTNGHPIDLTEKLLNKN